MLADLGIGLRRTGSCLELSGVGCAVGSCLLLRDRGEIVAGLALLQASVPLTGSVLWGAWVRALAAGTEHSGAALGRCPWFSVRW